MTKRTDTEWNELAKAILKERVAGGNGHVYVTDPKDWAISDDLCRFYDYYLGQVGDFDPDGVYANGDEENPELVAMFNGLIQEAITRQTIDFYSAF